MARKMFARLTAQGTAAAETAVCDLHIDLSVAADDTIGEPVECTDNDALKCQVCGAEGEYVKQIVISGNPVDGLTFTGPFPDTETAAWWAEHNVDEWWLAPLTPPEVE